MGFGGAERPALHTQSSRDGGIDGVIDQDALGLSWFYVQTNQGPSLASVMTEVSLMAYEIDPREIELVARQNRERNKLSDEFYAAHPECDIETVWPAEAHMEWEKLVAPMRARHQQEADELGAVLDAEKAAVQDGT